MNITKYTEHDKDALFNNGIPFWEKYSPDKEHEGYFTCLDREGKVYDTDKFIWLQCRQAWLFSMLYNRVEAKQEWFEHAIHGAEFLKNNEMDSDGNWYFSMMQDGTALVQPYNIFSDCFAAMAFAHRANAYFSL